MFRSPFERVGTSYDTSASSASRSSGATLLSPRPTAAGRRRSAAPGPPSATASICGASASTPSRLPRCQGRSLRSTSSPISRVHVFGIDFASIHLDGTFAGPGRWPRAGNAEVQCPGAATGPSGPHRRALRQRPRYAQGPAPAARQIAKVANWSARSFPPAGNTPAPQPGRHRRRRRFARPSARLAELPAEARPVRAAADKASGSGSTKARSNSAPVRSSWPGCPADFDQGDHGTTFVERLLRRRAVHRKCRRTTGFSAVVRSYTGYQLASGEFQMGRSSPSRSAYEEPISACRRQPCRSARAARLLRRVPRSDPWSDARLRRRGAFVAA